MSIQEAAATKVPAVSSNLVPFAEEYLLGKKVQEIGGGENLQAPVRQGEGAFVVKADDVAGFALALETLLVDDRLREQMGQGAYAITIPYFTWPSMVESFLKQIGVALP